MLFLTFKISKLFFFKSSIIVSASKLSFLLNLASAMPREIGLKKCNKLISSDISVNLIEEVF